MINCKQFVTRLSTEASYNQDTRGLAQVRMNFAIVRVISVK